MNGVIVLAAQTDDQTWLDLHQGSVVAVATVVLAVITFFYAWFTKGLLNAAHQQRERELWLQESEQARRVGGYIVRQQALALGPHGYQPVAGREWILLHVVNASELPVRAVRGVLYKVGVEAPTHSFRELPVLLPGLRQPPDPAAEAYEAETGSEYYLRLVFDDDAGVTWEKYGPERLRILRSPYRLPAGQ